MHKQTYRVDEVALMLDIGRSTAYDAVRRGEIPSVRIGRRIVIPRQALENLLAVADNNSEPDREGREVK